MKNETYLFTLLYKNTLALVIELHNPLIDWNNAIGAADTQLLPFDSSFRAQKNGIV